MGRWRIKGLKTKVERECSISRRRVKLYCGGIHVGGVREGSHSVTCGDIASWGQLQECGLSRVLNLERGSCEHFRWIHLEQVQHCTDLPRQVTFPAHTEQGKMGQGFG